MMAGSGSRFRTLDLGLDLGEVATFFGSDGRLQDLIGHSPEGSRKEKDSVMNPW